VNRLAASLAPRTVAEGLAWLGRVEGRIGVAEIRLDLLPDGEVEAVVGAAMMPVVATCRPVREGGAFAGAEGARLARLRRAVDAGAAWVDVEWDCEGASFDAQVMVSRHWHEGMPADLLASYDAMRSQGDAVKVVALASGPADVAAALDVLGQADRPSVVLAMGQAGRLSRLLAPVFPQCLMTYGSVAPEVATAPGQLTIDEMAGDYALHRAGPGTGVHLHVGPAPVAEVIRAANLADAGRVVHVAAEQAEVDAVGSVLARYLDNVEVTAGW